MNGKNHGLQTLREEIAFTSRPKIQSQSQIFRYGGSIFCLPHRPNFSDVINLCLHWVSVVCAYTGPWYAIWPKPKTTKTVPPDIIVFLGGYGHTKFAMLNIFWCFLSSERVTGLVRGPYFKVKFALQKWSQTSPILILALHNMKK